MKKNILLCILVILGTCGCSVNYNIYIDSNNNIEETTIISSDGNEQLEKDYLYELYKEELPIYYDEQFLYYDPYSKVEGYTYYKKDIKDNSYGYEATLNAKYYFKDYNRSRITHESVSNIDIYFDSSDKTYNLYLDEFKILDGENYVDNINVQIKLSPELKIISSNADIVNNNTLTWNIKDKYRSVVLKYKVIKELIDNNTTNKEIINNSEVKILFVSFILVMSSFLLYMIFRNKKGKY